jgi:hypothetical protein
LKTRAPKRPGDPNQLAKLIVDLAAAAPPIAAPTSFAAMP